MLKLLFYNDCYKFDDKKRIKRMEDYSEDVPLNM